MRYLNHLGAVFDFDAPGIYTHRDALRDYSWDITLLNGRIASAKRAEVSIPIVVNFVMSPAKCNAAKERLRAVLDADPIAGKTGRLYDGAWYVACILQSSSKALWWYGDDTARCNLSFLASEPVWIREHASSFSRGDTSGGLNFPFDFPFGFELTGDGSRFVENPGLEPSPVKLTIYGPAKSPVVIIGGNRYEVDVEVKEGGRLVIDGMSKTIDVEDMYGRKENAFSRRCGNQREGSGSYVFQKLDSGHHAVTWDGSFAFDAVVFERGSESGWGR